MRKLPNVACAVHVISADPVQFEIAWRSDATIIDLDCYPRKGNSPGQFIAESSFVLLIDRANALP